MKNIKVPSYLEMFNPVLNALKELGGSGTNEEIDDKSIEIAKVTKQQLAVKHIGKGGFCSEVQYSIAWAKTYLKKYGLLENSVRGVWSLTSKGWKTNQLNEKEVVQFVRKQIRNNRQRTIEETSDIEKMDVPDLEQEWRTDLFDTLIKMPRQKNLWVKFGSGKCPSV